MSLYFDHEHEPLAVRGAVTRRELLAAFAAAGIGTMLPWREAPAQTGATGARRLDLHHHYASPRWKKRVLEGKRQGWDTTQSWTPAKDIELMDAGGVQTAFVSMTDPGPWFGDDFSEKSRERSDAISNAREMNEYGARLKSDYRGRFGLWAALPLPDIDASLKEIEYALDTLHADGIGIFTSYGNIWPGEDILRPVFDELNRRSAIVFVHPVAANCCRDLAQQTPITVEWLSDTGRAINSMLSTSVPYYGGPIPTGHQPTRTSAATRYANVKFIWSHGGGSLIAIADRVIGNISAEALARPTAVNSKLYHIRRFYYDTADSANPILMQGLKMLVGASQIVFGTDVPWNTPANTARGLANCGFTADELRGIDRENALRILPQYRTA